MALLRRHWLSAGGASRSRPTVARVAARLPLILVLAHVLASAPAVAAIEGEPAATRATPTAPVRVDGTTLFHVRGVEAYPAQVRASAIARTLKAVAESKRFKSDTLRIVESDFGTEILAGSLRLMIVVDADAELENVTRAELARVIAPRMVTAIRDYRDARAPGALLRGVALAGVATALLVLLFLFFNRTWKGIAARLEAAYRKQVKSVGIGTFEILRPDQLWVVMGGMIGALRGAILLIAVFIYVEYVMGLFPWTRATAGAIQEQVKGPLESIGRGVAAAIPNLIFLVILFLVVRYLVKLLGLFFAAIGRGEVALGGFERDWADVTFKLLRGVIIGFALVVAYPYIPGSSSDAFKGISVFAGILLSLGASSAVANTIAGYLIIYRRAFKVGDVVKIGGTFGHVLAVRAQVTHIRTVKNEEVVVPNSLILNSEVINFNTLIQERGLILHTTVNIGYETPWRQVEGMLLAAAQRTEGLLTEPPPFVLVKELGTFAILYELNVYSSTCGGMALLYSAMHRNVLDVFNEHGVQIMTPAYEGDPESPKVVPRARWNLPPADPPADAPDR